jgi:hypothetical protein
LQKKVDRNSSAANLMPPRDAHNIWNKGLDEECGEDSDGKVSSYIQLRMGRTFSPTTAASLSTRAHLFVETDLIAEDKAFRSSLPDSLPRNTFISKTELEMSATHSLDRGFCSIFYISHHRICSHRNIS